MYFISIHLEQNHLGYIGGPGLSSMYLNSFSLNYLKISEDTNKHFEQDEFNTKKALKIALFYPKTFEEKIKHLNYRIYSHKTPQNQSGHISNYHCRRPQTPWPDQYLKFEKVATLLKNVEENKSSESDGFNSENFILELLI